MYSQIAGRKGSTRDKKKRKVYTTGVVIFFLLLLFFHHEEKLGGSEMESGIVVLEFNLSKQRLFLTDSLR